MHELPLRTDHLMPVLKNTRHEKFCQSLAKGKTASDAYEEAGYVPNRHNASFLKTNQTIINRVMELQEKRSDKMVLSRQYVVDALIENAEKALGRKPVKIGSNGEAKEVFVYRGDVANTAIRLAGLEFGMFKEKSEVTFKSELSKLSDTELLEVLVKEAEEAQQLLEYHGDTSETDES